VAWQAADGGKIRPNTIRFITPPLTSCDYVYITDADFLFLNTGLIRQHFRFMKRRGLPYSNSVRPEADRMSGLHFTKTDAFYPLPSLEGLDLRENDEIILREICIRKGLHIQDEEWFRPSPGIHMSPNREVLPSIVDGRKIPGWSVGPWSKTYRELAAHPDFGAFRKTLSDRLQDGLAQIDQTLRKDA
jgi:hypothetical protein